MIKNDRSNLLEFKEDRILIFSAIVSDGTFPCNTAVLQGDIYDVVRQAAEIGYEAVQLTVNNPIDIDVDNILKATNQYNIKVSSLATGRMYTIDGLSLGSGDEHIRQKCVSRMKEHVDIAERLGGAMVIVGAVRGWSTDAASWKEYHNQFDRSIKEIIDYASEHNIAVILEANDHLETDIYINLAETAEYIRSFNSPYFKLHLDTMHMFYENEEIYQQILDNHDIIAQIDISGEDRTCPDGEKYDYPLVMKALKDIDYQGYLAFEYKPEPPRNASKIGFDYIKGLL